MHTRITARQFAASDGVRSHVARALEKLGRYTDRIHDAHVVLHDGATRADKRAEIALSAPRQTFTAACAASSIEAAVDGCVRQLRRQVTRHKGRLRRGKGSDAARA